MSKPKKAQVWTRRQALWLMTGFTGSIALHACGQQSSTSSESTKAETGSNELTSAATGSTLWIGYTPLYIALEKGFFKEEGLNLDYKVFSGTGEADAAFAAGRLQGENVVTSEAVALASRGLDYRIIMVADTSFGGDGILASNSIGSIADFKGERIAVEEGGVSHFFLLQVLNKEARLSGDDISIVNVTPDAAAAAYQTGKVDIAVTYSPFLQKANQARQDGRIIYDTSKMPTAIVDVYIFSPQFIEENPGTAKAFVRGILRGKEFLNTNREEALAIAGERLELAPEQVAEQLKGVNLTSLKKNVEMLGNPQSDIYLAKHMNSLGQFLENQKQIQKVPGEMPKLLDPQFVEAVGKNA